MEVEVRHILRDAAKEQDQRCAGVTQPLAQDDPRQRKPDITLAKKHLGWTPAKSLQEGLRPTVKYFRDLIGQGL